MNSRYLTKAFLLLILLSSPLSSSPIGQLEKVVIPLNKWASQRVLSTVVGQLIEKLNTPIEYLEIGSDRQWGALKRGIIHFQIEVWEPSMKEEFDKHLANGDIIDLGTHQAKVIEDWWYPKYVEALCPELPHWEALNSCRALFTGRSTMNKGVYFAGPWDYGDADIIRALKLKYTIERLPNEFALWNKLKNSIETNHPVIILNWSPNWTDNYIEGSFVDFPQYTEQCESSPEWGLNKKLTKDCGNRRNGWLKKAGSLSLKQDFPRVYDLIKNISFTHEMVALASSLSVVEGLSDKEAALVWSKKYAKDINKWLSEMTNFPK
jgi:glycine betaine/proline transport system substrate-binding protein